MAGALAIVPADGTIATVASAVSIVPRVGERVVVLDTQGRYVLVQIQSVSPDALSFAYAFGTPENRPATLGNSVWVDGHPLVFSASVRRGQVMLSGNGEIAAAPGFNFELDRQVGTLRQTGDVRVAVANGRIVLTGDLSAVGANGHAAGWPAPANVAPVSGSMYLAVDAAGNYALLQTTAVSATMVAFDYRLLPARAVPVLTAGSVTLHIAGSAVTFSGPPKYGAILASSGTQALIAPGFDLERDREVSGLNASPDMAVETLGSALLLRGVAATVGQLATGEPPDVSDVSALPLTRLIVVDSAGRYVLVGIESATARAIAFAYEIQSAGATAVLQPPDPATVPGMPPPAQPGALVYSEYTDIGGATRQLMRTYELSIRPYAVWPFAHADATEGVALSPDGRWLATVAGGNIVLWTAGGVGRTVADNGNVLGGTLPVVAWSPDSRYLAYTGMVDEGGYESGSALWVIQPSSGKSRLVIDPTRTGIDVAYVGWMPHDRLVVSSGKALYEVSADWTHVVRLPVNVGTMGQDGRFDVSADGAMVTWVARDANGHDQVMVATVDGRQRVQFTQGRRDTWSPQFSPDDSTVVFVAGVGPAPGGELWGFTLNGRQSGYLDAPGSTRPIDHVFDLAQWASAADATRWKG